MARTRSNTIRRGKQTRSDTQVRTTPVDTGVRRGPDGVYIVRRALRLYRRQGRMTVKEISEFTGVPQKVVRRDLRRHSMPVTNNPPTVSSTRS